MFSIKEIRNKINSINKIQKITKAMEMISFSKMRKIYQVFLSVDPYIKIMQKVIEHILLGSLEYKHSYIVERNIVRIGYLVVSTDRGLVGSLNTNLFKNLLIDMKKWSDKGIDSSFFLIGNQAISFLNFLNKKVITKIAGLGDNPTLSILIGITTIIFQLYEEHYLDKLFIISNKFTNILFQKPQILQILPILPLKNVISTHRKKWDYIYEPNDPKLLLNILLKRYIESEIYQKVVENLVCEQAARMMAMKGASDNGSALIKDLKIIYNKVRQDSITQELSEIISGNFAT
ncbi:F0F1 ATP synthase subunit gamma [Blochmannia endosymbiont of Colobopsis nipponica]|uniref:F0F1 ATP synthase subunit gamma n=1 Tax=Blochmannia endosymbiont of Colobopsis nipponica TaxID=2681987 RepID=UPI001785BCC7|nr:F0F1 ATP synthase subunit gamma [Blochmannia endosymbiont of Colobopsis nipponica]QOI10838.1 F0F1 ATP synthase subunit gamma [Blochmannia endosymbiont of Colobopsis nipponica]